MNVLVQILKGGNLLLALSPVAIELALKIKHLFAPQPDITVNITSLAGEAITADDDTIQLVADWKKQHNLA
jgi:hypothetical protein